VTQGGQRDAGTGDGRSGEWPCGSRVLVGGAESCMGGAKSAWVACGRVTGAPGGGWAWVLGVLDGCLGSGVGVEGRACPVWVGSVVAWSSRPCCYRCWAGPR